MLVDAANVRRSEWPNVLPEELVERCRRWAEANGYRIVIVFDGPAPVEEEEDVVGSGEESADDWLIRHAAEYRPYWLVTSDRALREAAGAEAERTIGGGSFARKLREFAR